MQVRRNGVERKRNTEEKKYERSKVKKNIVGRKK